MEKLKKAFQPSAKIRLRLPTWVHDGIKDKARRCGVAYDDLIKIGLTEMVEREAKPRPI